MRVCVRVCGEFRTNAPSEEAVENRARDNVAKSAVNSARMLVIDSFCFIRFKYYISSTLYSISAMVFLDLFDKFDINIFWRIQRFINNFVSNFFYLTPMSSPDSNVESN